MSRIIGIDLGTSNSAAAVMRNGRAVIIPSAEGISIGGKSFPSCVAFTKDGQILVGEPARRQAVMNPDGTITGIKRKMGTDYKVNVFGKEYRPEEISAFILKKIKNDAEEFLGEPVEKAVITVPAYFNDNQRQATKDAGAIAGIDVVRIINEPTAAALAYGLDKADDQKIMVFDLGGGTLDVTILEIGNGVFEVLSTSGDTQLGGRDIDDRLVRYITEKYLPDLRDAMALQRLREAVEIAKIELSSVAKTTISLPYITTGADGPVHLNLTLTRDELNDLITDLLERCRKPVMQALSDAGLDASDIDKIVLVGGPTRMPAVRQFVETMMGRKAEHGIDPMECVAIGAAIQAGIITGEVNDVLLLDVTPLSLGIETIGGIMTKLIERNTTIPTRKSQIFTTAVDGQDHVVVHVLQGERPLAKDNITLGRFVLDNIPPAPKGVPMIEVTFDIDVNGILHVSAKDLGTNNVRDLTIQSPSRLTKEEIDRMIEEASRYVNEDNREVDEIKAILAAKDVCDRADKVLESLDIKEEDLARQIIASKDRLADAMQNEKKNVVKIRQYTEELQQILLEYGKSLYANKTGTSKPSGKTRKRVKIE